MTSLPMVTYYVKSGTNVEPEYVDCKDPHFVINTCLFKNSIPMELRTIVIDQYLGEDSKDEHFTYKSAVDCVSKLFNRVALPFIDDSPFKFTMDLNHTFGFWVGTEIQDGLQELLVINPSLFYECYLKAHPNAVVQRRPSSLPPSLAPPPSCYLTLGANQNVLVLNNSFDPTEESPASGARAPIPRYDY